uniref:Uncharacterized protein n=1 Tax=Timema cristinae TaxID=61476 RepID=A0A7R9DMA9_TIMCR|nr:unnamed protein product [Timema cristinae]
MPGRCLVQLGATMHQRQGCGNSLARSYGLYMWLPEMFNTMSKFSALHPEEAGSICVAYTKSGNATNNIISWSKLNETSFSGSSLSAGNRPMEEALAPTCSSVVNPETFQKTLVVGGLTLLGASGSGIALDFVSSSVPVVGFSCLVVSLLFTCISVLSAFIVDIFPTHLRSVNTSYFTGTSGITMTSSMYDSHSKYNSLTSHHHWSPHIKHWFDLRYTDTSVAGQLPDTLADSRTRQPTQLTNLNSDWGGMAVSLSLMIGRIGIVAGSFVVGTLLEVNCFFTFFLLGGIPLGCAFLTFFLPSNQEQTK